MKFATAPGTWGIEPPPKPSDPPWQRILDEIARAGFDGSELGPYGYYPTDLDELSRAFAQRDLELPVGFVMESLVALANGEVLDIARRTCASVAHGGGSTLVLIDALNQQRTQTAGRSEAAPRLRDAEWSRLLETVDAMRALAGEWGLAVAFHPHAGTWVEFEDEIARLMADVDPAVGLCLDTGHAVYAGVDPVDLIERYAPRVAHVHLKDLDVAVLSRCLAEGGSFLSSVAAGVFTPLGDGSVDLSSVSRALGTIGYAGWATFEQDRVLATIDNAPEECRRSLAHARALGFGDLGFPDTR